MLTCLLLLLLHQSTSVFLQLEQADCWEDAIDGVLTQFEKQNQRRATYTICYY